MGLTLHVLEERFAVCRLAPSDPVPLWAWSGAFASVTRTPAELSIVCLASAVPDGVARSDGWRALQVQGPLDFSLVGILAALSAVLAHVEVSLFAVSTYDTDYLLVREGELGKAVAALRGAGHEIQEG